MPRPKRKQKIGINCPDNRINAYGIVKVGTITCTVCGLFIKRNHTTKTVTCFCRKKKRP